MSNCRAIVLLSGGQDSVTCLGWAIAKWGAAAVKAIGFNYGQQHNIELHQASKVTECLDVDFEILEVTTFTTLNDSALLANNGDSVNEQHKSNADLPASFVPGRNALFLTIAHAYAQKHGALNIVGGMCQTDYSGYPDCRAEFITSLENALNLGYETSISIQAPLMYLDKVATFALADIHGVLDVVLEHSHTCYNGDRSIRHEWGYGCGECPACKLRAKGWERYKQINGLS